MIASSMTRAVRLASRQHMALARFTAAPSASACSNLRTNYPGESHRPTAWQNDSREETSGVETIKSEADLTSILASASANPDSLVVVKFHAIMCDASAAVEAKFKRTAAEFASMDMDIMGEEGQGVTFADVCFDSNRQLCEKMGIRSVPHVQIFSGNSGKVADFSIAPPQYDTLTSLLAERRASVRARKQL